MTAILKVDTIQDVDGNNIINENANTVTIGKAGDTVNVVGTLQNNSSALISGITEADQWRLTVDLTGGADPITSNLDRVDNTGFGYIGTGMTVSSGIWTFPSTGIWLVRTNANISNGTTSSRYNRVDIFTTTDNSTYTEVSNAFGSISYVSSFTYQSMNNEIFFDVTDTSNCKVKFRFAPENGNTRLMGDTNINKTNFVFIRLGDT